MASIIIRKNEVDLSVNSLVKEVSVYSNRAIVTRTRTVRCTPGENRIYFSNLGTNIDEQSIKASVDARGAHIVSTSIEKNYLFFFREDEDEKTYGRILEVLTRLCEYADDKSVFALENRIISDLREYIKNLLNPLILAQENSIPKFKEALDFCESIIAKNTAGILSVASEAGKLAIEYGILKEKLAAIRSLDSREQTNILIIVNVDTELETGIDAGYTIAGASWKTSYDTKADTDAKTVELSCYGEIVQSTGESWEKAKVVLSTSDASSDVAIPKIYPVYLGGYPEKRKKDVMVEETAIKHLADDAIAGASLDADEESEPDFGAGGETIPGIEEGRVTSEKKGVSYSFTLAGLLDIPSDGKSHKGLITKVASPAEIYYETVPQLREYVYLKANVKNTLTLPLLPGNVFVFRNGSYMGKSVLGYVAPGEQFPLSFGIDDDLRVKRIVYKDLSIPARGLSARNAREWEFGYILYNYRKKPERVKLKEAIYVSSIKEIEVEILSDTTEGYSIDDNGIVSWDIDLPNDPFNHRYFVLRYTLSAPRDFDIGRL
jgi:uncharacterized protein (TIGR02231 family)